MDKERLGELAATFAEKRRLFTAEHSANFGSTAAVASFMTAHRAWWAFVDALEEAALIEPSSLVALFKEPP